MQIEQQREIMHYRQQNAASGPVLGLSRGKSDKPFQLLLKYIP
jgi:hypothetical protein